MVSYIEVIYKLYPDLNNVAGSGIEKLEDLVEQIKSEMKLRGVRSVQIFKDLKQENPKTLQKMGSVSYINTP